MAGFFAPLATARSAQNDRGRGIAAVAPARFARGRAGAPRNDKSKGVPRAKERDCRVACGSSQ